MVAVGAVLVIGAVAIVAWSRQSHTRSDRPPLQSGEVYGIDVSNHQKAIDWSRVADDDVAFAYLKATEGGDYVDEWFDENWEGAGDNGIRRGAYHFFTFCRAGIEQADNFLKVVPNDPDALPPVIDLEFIGNCSKRPTKDELHRELRDFMDRVEAATGKRVIFYLMDELDAEYGVRAAFDRANWRRSIGGPPPGTYLIWQAADAAAIAGIDGGVDLNVARPGFL